ncbi:Methyltransferase domain protein [Thermoplasmatales archaeon BRNA1]|nr:Methyltransferase domain protein [Thermoplasmatales archaeon BRNA1]
MIKSDADILDVCCGGRMFWFADRDDTVYMDVRDEDILLCDGRTYSVRPDIVADFREIPFPDSSFSMVVFDPPHLTRGAGWQVAKYGRLGKNWREDLRRGFGECMRVLRDGGFLVFKWSECQVPLKRISPLFPCEPMFGQRHGCKGSVWMVFRKEVADEPDS